VLPPPPRVAASGAELSAVDTVAWDVVLAGCGSPTRLIDGVAEEEAAFIDFY
jgi:hypothetical protein